MKIDLNTNLIPLFCGTYETMWEIREYNDDGDEVEVSYDFSDFMKSIQSVYDDQGWWIVKEMDIPWVKKIKFIGNWSPREYNFKTDQLDFQLTINAKEMLKKLAELKNEPEFKEFLHDKYTSYDGFWSWTPNNYADIYSSITENKNDFCQSLSAMITYLIKDKVREIQMDVYEEWNGNGYGGLDYTIDEPDGYEIL